MPNNAPWTWINKPAEAVEKEDFRGFKEAIDAGVDFVMSEHIAIPTVTNGSELPASVERKLASGWLRDRLGFEGILTSDDLWYDHVVERFGAEEVAVMAFEAGHDIILKPKVSICDNRYLNITSTVNLQISRRDSTAIIGQYFNCTRVGRFII